jgi:hypothetical protein
MTLRKGLPAKLAATDANDTRYDFNTLVVCNSDGSPRGGLTAPFIGSSILTATATMNTSVGAFSAVAVRDGGVVLLSNDGPTNVLHSAAPASNSRIDLIYAKQNDSSSTVNTPDGNDVPTIGIVQGTAAPSPTKPALPVGAVELGTVQIPAGATATNSVGVVVSQTAPYTAAPGGTVPFRTSTEMDTWSAPNLARAFNLADKMIYSRRNGAWLGGTITPSLSSPYTPAASPNAATIYCDNDRVYMESLITNSSTLNANAGQRYVMGSIPAAYAPARNLRFAVTSTTLFAIIEVTTTGEIAFYVSAGVAAAANTWNISLAGANWKLQ